MSALCEPDIQKRIHIRFHFQLSISSRLAKSDMEFARPHKKAPPAGDDAFSHIERELIEDEINNTILN